MTSVDQSKIRLRAYVAHFVDHADDHLAEIRALKPGIADDGQLTDLLERAIDDMQVACRSLQALLGELHPTHAGDHEHRDH